MAVLLDRAGWLAGVTGRALYRAGLALCGLAGDLDARADQAGIWKIRKAP